MGSSLHEVTEGDAKGLGGNLDGEGAVQHRLREIVLSGLEKVGLDDQRLRGGGVAVVGVT